MLEKSERLRLNVLLWLSCLLCACNAPSQAHNTAAVPPTLHCVSHFINVVVDSKRYQLVCEVRGPTQDTAYQLTGATPPNQGMVLHFTWCDAALVAGAATCQMPFIIIVPFAPTDLDVMARFMPSQIVIQQTIPLNG